MAPEQGQMPLAPLLVLVNLVLRTAGEDLLFAPVRDGTEGIAADEILKRLLVGPFTGDEIGGTVADVFPQRRKSVPVCRPQRADDSAELLFKVLLLALDDVVVHADSDHREISQLCLRFLTESS
jgi:hypothetical protein